MKLEKRDGSRERQVVTALVVSKEVLAHVASKWDGKMFASQWANVVAGLCCSYYAKYQEAPKKSVKGLFEAWAEKHKDQETVALVDKFLASISSEYSRTGDSEHLHPGHIIDMAGELFNRVRLQRLRDLLEGHIDSGDLQGAEEALQTHSRIEMGGESAEDLFVAWESVLEPFTTKPEPMVVYQDGLGVFFCTSMMREDFVCFMGPDKSGKSFYLSDFAYRAMCQRKKVAFFEVGDMSRDQLKMRFMVRTARHPYVAPGNKWPFPLRFPMGIKKDRDQEFPEVDWREKTFAAPLDVNDAWKACQALMKDKVRSNKSYFRLSCHPNDSINVKGIEAILDRWEREDGFVPDALVVDYADILMAPDHTRKMESRDQINATWKQLRALAQRRRCLVVTASQSDADAYKARLLDRHNFSGDKRKLSHVTAMVGINQTPEEKGLGLQRLNMIVLREGDFNPKRVCWVAQCLAIANPTMRSVFP